MRHHHIGREYLLNYHAKGLQAEGKAKASIDACARADRFFDRFNLAHRLKDIPAQIPDVLDEATAAGLSPIYTDKFLRLLKAAWARAVREHPDVMEGLPPKLKLPSVAKPRRRRVALSPVQARELLYQGTTAAPAIWTSGRTALMFGLYAGLRKEEIAHQRYEHMDLTSDSPFITVTKTPDGWVPKGNKDRVIPIPEVFANALLLRRDGAQKGWVFPGQSGGARTHMERLVSPAIKALGLPTDVGNGMHILRRTYATRLANQGVAINVISGLMGHSSTTVTQGYICDSPFAAKAAAAALSYDEEAP